MALRRTEREIRQVQEVLDAGASLESVQRAALAGAAGTPWDLGWLGHGQLAPAWRPALAALKPGEVSGVLEGDHERYWILQLLEVREAPVQSPEALRALVQQVLGAERALPAREAAEAALRAKAQVVIDKKE
jgi:parvulin-like peptidyl-prolyl isomerase